MQQILCKPNYDSQYRVAAASTSVSSSRCYDNDYEILICINPNLLRGVNGADILSH
jgi:hypothetical protein